MDSPEEESDEELKLQHWNNWEEPENEFSSTESAKESTEFVHDKSRFSPSWVIVSESRFGSWVPPTDFVKGCKRARRSNELIIENNEGGSNEKENFKLGQIDEPNVLKKCDSTFSSKWRVNEDWGERVELNDVTKFNDGDVVWGVVNLSCFNRIRMWLNQYKNLCVLAEGTISKVGSPESTFISIVNSELLRKMLSLKSDQWASLCQEVVESGANLNFDALLDFDETDKSSLDKLWFFICKRRHFLQEQCMLVKLSGAVKCMKRFEVVPKLVVQDIRNVLGKPIS